jgi:hypothetical protein
MKKLILSLMIFSSTLVMAQQPDGADYSKRLEALKIAFITEKLNLSSDEAQKFWPIYNNYEAELRQVLRDNKSGGNVLDKDEKLLNVRKRFQPEFTKVLGPQRVNKLYGAEKEFRGVLIKQLKNKQEHQRRDIKRPHR